MLNNVLVSEYSSNVTKQAFVTPVRATAVLRDIVTSKPEDDRIPLYLRTAGVIVSSIGGTNTGLVGTGTSGTNVTMTLNSAGLALSVNSPGTAVGTGFTTSSTTGSLLQGTLNSAGLNLNVPAWITTATGGGGSYTGNLDGGSPYSMYAGIYPFEGGYPDTNYGGVDPLDAGGVT